MPKYGMRFRKWLLNEDGFDGPGGNSWDVLYPTVAGDYVYAVERPLEHWWLQWKWRRGEEIGREMHNIDNDEFQKRAYNTSITSRNAPDGDSGFWRHKEDTENKGDFDVQTGLDLDWLMQGKTSKDVKTGEGLNFCCDPFGSHSLWTSKANSEKKLGSIFKDAPSGRFPEVPDHMDDAWVGDHVYETIVHGGVYDPWKTDGNSDMPDPDLNSKFCAKSSNGTKKRDTPEEKAANKYGFDAPDKKRKHMRAAERYASWIDTAKRKDTVTNRNPVYT